MRYSGSATLKGPDTQPITGECEVIQNKQGNIRATLLSNQAFRVFEQSLHDLATLAMDDPNRGKLRTETWHTTNIQHVINSNGKSKLMITGSINEVDVRRTHEVVARFVRVSFLITNLEFFGNETIKRRFQNRETIRADKINFHAEERSVELKQSANHSQAIERIKKNRSIEPTAWLTFKLDPGDDWNTAEALASDICTVLSLAAGNHVDWIEARCFDRHGKWVVTKHRAGITRPYTPTPLLNRTNSDGLKQLLEKGMPALRHWDRQLASNDEERPLRNAIRLFFDTNSGGIFLQSRTAVCVILIEMLAGKVRKKGRLQQQLQTLVRTAGLATERMLVNEFKLIRDSIVHTGDYHQKMHISPVDQHALMVEFAACVLLGFLGYEGKYHTMSRNWAETTLPLAQAPQAQV